VSFPFEDESDVDRPPDPMQEQAEIALTQYFLEHNEAVFFSRQIELHFEDRFFHWITNRALRSLIDQRLLATENYPLSFGGKIKLIWPRSYRFYRRRAKEVVDLVSEYSLPHISEGLGDQGELMVLEGLVRNRCMLLGRNCAEYRGVRWTQSEHDLDLVVERDGVGYGVEVKNTLPYIDQADFLKKSQICKTLGLKPIFAVRMMPKTWIFDLQKAGGYSLILKSQFYPWGQRELARRVAAELGLPVICTKAIEQGAFDRLLEWHSVNCRNNSPPG
jgi:hypothetical protein